MYFELYLFLKNKCLLDYIEVDIACFFAKTTLEIKLSSLGLFMQINDIFKVFWVFFFYKGLIIWLGHDSLFTVTITYRFLQRKNNPSTDSYCQTRYTVLRGPYYLCFSRVKLVLYTNCCQASLWYLHINISHFILPSVRFKSASPDTCFSHETTNYHFCTLFTTVISASSCVCSSNDHMFIMSLYVSLSHCRNHSCLRYIRYFGKSLVTLRTSSQTHVSLYLQLCVYDSVLSST